MILIICIDEDGGMAFNRRRQTRDVAQRRHLNRKLKGKVLWMSPYSGKLFEPDLPDVSCKISPDYIQEASKVEASKAEASKAEASKAEASKAEASKAEAHKIEASKNNASQAESGQNTTLKSISPVNESPSPHYILAEREFTDEMLEHADAVMVYHWNRSYPEDVSFPLERLEEFKLKEQEEFAGSSHDKITFELYERA